MSIISRTNSCVIRVDWRSGQLLSVMSIISRTNSCVIRVDRRSGQLLSVMLYMVNVGMFQGAMV